MTEMEERKKKLWRNQAQVGTIWCGYDSGRLVSFRIFLFLPLGIWDTSWSYGWGELIVYEI